MRSFIDVLLEIVVGLATAIGLATVIVVASVAGVCCAAFGCSYCWKRSRSGRLRRKDCDGTGG